MTVYTLDATTGEATERPMTQQEAAQRAADEAHAQQSAAVEATRTGNRGTLEDRARAALAVNRDYLALANPTAAQQRAHLAALTRECTALIRVVLSDYDGTD